MLPSSYLYGEVKTELLYLFNFKIFSVIEAPKNVHSTEFVVPTREIEPTETIHYNTPEENYKNRHYINEIGGGSSSSSNRKTDYNVDKHNTNIISYDILDSGNDESKKKSRKFGSGFMASSKASLPTLMLHSEYRYLTMS